MDPGDYKVQLEVFEGPLDLLLYLIKRDELDILDIPIVPITEQYLAYLNLMQMLDLNIAGEFLVMASTLLLIKSRMLLPREERAPLEDEEEDVDPRWDLIRQLVEYKKFKDAASFLEEQELRQDEVFARGQEETRIEADPEAALRDVSLFDLLAAFQTALQRIPAEDLRDIAAERFTVADKIGDLLARLRDHASFSFLDLIRPMRSRAELVCTFLAILELIRLRQIRVGQESHFGDILIERRDDDGVVPALVPEAGEPAVASSVEAT